MRQPVFMSLFHIRPAGYRRTEPMGACDDAAQSESSFFNGECRKRRQWDEIVSACIDVDAELVRHFVFDLAEFARVGESGVTRLVYSPEWVAATDQYATWCEESGLAVRRDAVGSVWGRLEGTEGG